MKETYPLFLDGKTVGTVSLAEDGLYWNLSCTCRLPLGEIYELLACWEAHSLSLGIPVPNQGTFELTKHIPKKNLPRENLSFRIKNRRDPKETAVPVFENAPFSQLQKLPASHLEIRGGTAYIVFPVP